MLKKLVASLLIGTSILTASPGIYAENVESLNFVVNQPEEVEIINMSEEEQIRMAYNRAKRTLKTNRAGYEVINPDRRSFSTSSKVALINGKAPARSNVTIRLYRPTNVKKGSYNLNRLPKNGDYVLASSSTVRSGNLGFFQKQLNLVNGINKIQVDFNRPGVNPIEIIVYVYGRTPSLNEIISVVR